MKEQFSYLQTHTTNLKIKYYALSYLLLVVACTNYTLKTIKKISRKNLKIQNMNFPKKSNTQQFKKNKKN